jgi:TRAP-type C4-dicarboxylate transport system permease large subunit
MRRLKGKTLYAALLETIRLSSVTLVIVVGAVLFSAFLAVGQLPFALANFLSGLEVSRYLILAIVLIMYLLLGCLMDTLAMVLLTIPIVFPVIQAVGFDPIWFGVIMALTAEQAMITPPIGVNVFCVYAVAQDVPMYTIFRGIIPFWCAHMTCMIILIIFPQIATFLPNFMR